MKPRVLGAEVLAALNGFLSDSAVRFASVVRGDTVVVSLLTGGFQTDVTGVWTPGVGYEVTIREEKVGDGLPNPRHLVAARGFVVGFFASAGVRDGPRLGVAAVMLTGKPGGGGGWDLPKVLMGRRTSLYGRGTWGLPGGIPEDRESFAKAVEREFLKETGARCTVVEKLGVGQSYRPDFGTVFFRVRLDHRDRHKITELLGGTFPEDSHDAWEMKKVSDVTGGWVNLFRPGAALRDLLASVT